MEQHIGKLTVTSDGPGKGASFTVELPLFRRTAPPTKQNGLATWNGACGTSSTLTAAPCARRLLVVDDAASNRKTRGFVCEQAEDGQQAIDLYRAPQDKREKEDTIVMDYEMPVMNDPTTTKKLRG